jgi:sialidase-1
MVNEIVAQFDPTPEHPRHSEGSFVTLKDGRILFAYTQYTGGRHDSDEADIAVVTSADHGKTWSEPTILVKNYARLNVMSTSARRLDDGRLVIWYLVKRASHDCRPDMIVSWDEGETWTEPVTSIPYPGYFVTNNDRIIQLSTGRLVIPANFHRARGDFPTDSRATAHWFLSDDRGETWREAKDWWALPVRGGSGLQETGVVELTDGRLWSYARTNVGRQWQFFSDDQGETWSPPEPSEFISPNSPLSVKRIPDTNKLLAIWNDHSGRFPVPEHIIGITSDRTPLVSSIGDAGTAQAWTGFRVVDDEKECGFCYTAIHFVDDPDGMTVLLAYCAGSKLATNGLLNRLRIRRVSLDWFMERC